MEAHCIKPYLSSSKQFLLAVPKSALAQGQFVTTSPLRKRFGIRAIYDNTGIVRRPKGIDRQERIAAATRAGALRALSAACAYHHEIAVVGGGTAAESSAPAGGGSAASSCGSRDFGSQGSSPSTVASDAD